MVLRARGGVMMGNKYFIPIRGVINRIVASSPAVGSDAHGMGRSGPSTWGIRNGLFPAIKTRERTFLPLYAFRFSIFRIFRFPNLRTLRLPSLRSPELAISFGKYLETFLFDLAVGLFPEVPGLNRRSSLQLLLLAIVLCSDPVIPSTSNYLNISKYFYFALSSQTLGCW